MLKIDPESKNAPQTPSKFSNQVQFIISTLCALFHYLTDSTKQIHQRKSEFDLFRVD